MKITRRSFLKKSIYFGGALSFPARLLNASPKAPDQWAPAYATLANQGKLDARIEQARAP